MTRLLPRCHTTKGLDRVKIFYAGEKERPGIVGKFQEVVRCFRCRKGHKIALVFGPLPLSPKHQKGDFNRGIGERRPVVAGVELRRQRLLAVSHFRQSGQLRMSMGEATPGPLILVVTFIGFLASWKTMPAGDPMAGVWGAAIATAFACIPSFAMVLGLAPWVRSIHPGSRLDRALAAIGVVVVGMLLGGLQ